MKLGLHVTNQCHEKIHKDILSPAIFSKMDTISSAEIIEVSFSSTTKSFLFASQTGFRNITLTSASYFK